MNQENTPSKKTGKKWKILGILGIVISCLWFIKDGCAGASKSSRATSSVEVAPSKESTPEKEVKLESKQEAKLLEAVSDKRKLFNNNTSQLDWSKDGKKLVITDHDSGGEFSFRYLQFEEEILYYKGQEGVVAVGVSGDDILGYAIGKNPEDAKKTLEALE